MWPLEEPTHSCAKTFIYIVSVLTGVVANINDNYRYFALLLLFFHIRTTLYFFMILLVTDVQPSKAMNSSANLKLSLKTIGHQWGFFLVALSGQQVKYTLKKNCKHT